MELVERTTYIDALSDRFRQAEKGAGHSVFVMGEAGIGKTSLINYFLEGLGALTKIYVGACDSLFTPRPLGPLYDIAGQVGGDLLNLLRTEKNRAAIFASFLQELSTATSPAVVVFEDVHWADEATVDFIKFLTRRVNRFKCLFVVSFRDDGVHADHPLHTMFGEFASGSFTKLHVDRLSREAVNHLAKIKGHSSGDDVYALTEGNPFYVSEILASYSPGVPERVKDSILTVFRQREKKVQGLWELLSILPGGVSFDFLKKIDQDVEKGLEDCIKAGVVVNRQDHLSFKHELYRLTIEESLTPHYRKDLHAKVLKVMLEDDTTLQNLAQLVHHAKFAEDRELVARTAPRAAQEAASVGAHIEASKLYLTAIEYTDPSDPIMPELYERHAYECYLTNQLTVAITSQQRALDIWRERKVRLKIGDTSRFLSRLWWFEANRSEAMRLAQEAIEVLENGFPTRERAMAYSNLSQLAMLGDDPAKTLLWGQKAIELATRMEDLEVLAHALNNVGAVLHKFGSETEGEEKLKQSLSIALKNGFHEHAARAYTNLSSMSITNKRYGKAKQAFDEGLKYCEERDLNSWMYYMHSQKVRMLLETGAWDDAEALALTLQSNHGHSAIIRMGALTTLGRLHMRRGNMEKSRELIAEAKQVAAPTGEAPRIIHALTAELEFCWLNQEPFPIEELKAAEETLFPEKNKSWQYTELSYWKRKCGLPVPVNDDVEFMGPFRMENNGNWKGAAELWAEMGCAYEQALALFEGDEDHQRQALVLLDGLGAVATSDLLKAQLKQKGVRNIPRGPRESTRNNPAQLTARQVEVLHLLREGSQNKEIADKLFISPKTVDHHVSAILSKLEVNSRAKAVVEGRKLGILK